MSNEDRKKLLVELGTAIHKDATTLCESGLAFAEIGGGLTAMCALAAEKGTSRSVVVIFNGPVPDDLIESLGNFCRGLTQDLKTSGVVRQIYGDE